MKIFFLTMAIYLSLASQAAFGQGNCRPYKASDETVCSHTVRLGQNLSSLLYRISQPIPLCLYTSDGWLAPSKLRNPNVKDWKLLPVGAKILLVVPSDSASVCEAKNTPAPAEDTATPVEDDPSHVEDTATPVEDDPSHVEDTATSVEDDPSHVEDTATPVEENSAPVDGASVPPEENPNRIGLLYGVSSSSEVLMRNAKWWSLYVGGDVPALRHMTLAFDTIPRVSDTTGDRDVTFSLNRLIVAKNFILFPQENLNFSLSPRIGRYDVKTTLPRRLDEDVILDTMNLTGLLSLGYEVKATVAWYRVALSPWFAQDMPYSREAASIAAFTWGVTAAFSVSPRSSKESLNLLTFMRDETLAVKDKDPVGGISKELKLDIGMRFYGVGLEWNW